MTQSLLFRKGWLTEGGVASIVLRHPCNVPVLGRQLQVPEEGAGILLEGVMQEWECPYGFDRPAVKTPKDAVHVHCCSPVQYL